MTSRIAAGLLAAGLSIGVGLGTAAASQPEGLKGYGGQPGHQTGGGHHGNHGNGHHGTTGYEGQPGNQGG